MRKHSKKILAGVVCLTFLFILSSLFGCKTIPLKQSVPEFKIIYNEALDKTYNIPSEFPDPYDEKAVEEYDFRIYPLSPTLPMLMYFKVDENGKMISGTPLYLLVYDGYTNEIVSAALYVDEDNAKYWIYRDGQYPSLCAEYEQEDWLYRYDNGLLEKEKDEHESI